jgi:protein phosphatase 1 regulatory subunit 7
MTNEEDEIPKGDGPTNKLDDQGGSPPPAATPPPGAEDTQELIVVNEHTEELDLNHGRIGKIENLEPLKKLQR